MMLDEPIERPGAFACIADAFERLQTERTLLAQIEEIAAKS